MHGVSKNTVGGAMKRLRARSFAPTSQRMQSTTTTTTPESTHTPPSSSKDSSGFSLPPPHILSSLLIHRAPLLTPAPTPFETAYHAYSSSLHAALSNPVPVDFYFKKGSLAERRFTRAQWERERGMFGERLAGKRVEVGDIPEERGVEVVLREEGEVDLERVGGEGEGRKVERRGERNLYLVVKGKDGRWGLPEGRIEGAEALHESAIRNLHENLGDDMDTWLVSRQPISLLTDGDKQIFLFKSHILAGQPALTPSSKYSDWAWLTKQEMEGLLRTKGREGLWEQVEGVLSA